MTIFAGESTVGRDRHGPQANATRRRRFWAGTAAVGVGIGAACLQAFATVDTQPLYAGHPSVGDVTIAIAVAAALYAWFDLRSTRAALATVERLHRVVDNELELAAEVQRRLLPKVPHARDGIHYAARLHPAEEIGGDFYDFIPLADGGLLVLVGDVSGKGIPAALLQASTLALFRTYAHETTDPGELVRLVSREIFGENQGAQYVTCLAVRLHGHTVTYVNAGHPVGFIIGAAGPRLLDAGGLPVGLFAETTYQCGTVTLEVGDTAVMVTDGITEAVEPGALSAADYLMARLRGGAGRLTADRACDELMELAEHAPGPIGVSDWYDDKTVVAFHIE